MLVHLTGMAGKAKARCEWCNTRCSAALPIEPSWMRLPLQVMDNPMPHTIRDVVPLVTQPMIDHLRGKNRH